MDRILSREKVKQEDGGFIFDDEPCSRPPKNMNSHHRQPDISNGRRHEPLNQPKSASGALNGLNFPETIDLTGAEDKLSPHLPPAFARQANSFPRMLTTYNALQNQASQIHYNQLNGSSIRGGVFQSDANVSRFFSPSASGQNQLNSHKNFLPIQYRTSEDNRHTSISKKVAPQTHIAPRTSEKNLVAGRVDSQKLTDPTDSCAALLNPKSRTSTPITRGRAVPEFTPISLVMKSWTCGSCAEQDIGCDGERPCSSCREPGIACHYEGRPQDKASPKVAPVSRQTGSRPGAEIARTKLVASPKPPRPVVGRGLDSLQSSTAPSTRPTSVSSRNEPSKPPLPSDDEDAETQVNGFQNGNRPTLIAASRKAVNVKATAGRHAAHRSSGLSPPANGPSLEDRASQGSPAGEQMLLEIEEVRGFVERYETQMRSHQEYLVQPLLHQARLDSAEVGPFQAGSAEADPFVTLGSHSLPTADESTPTAKQADKLQLRTKSYSNGVAQHAQWKISSIPTKDFQVDATAIPKYKSIGHVGPSLLSRNYRTLKYMPYYAENEYADEAHKKRYEDMESRYDQDIPQLTSQRTCREKVSLWRPWVTLMLADLNLSHETLCYYYVSVENSSWQPKVQLSDSAFAAWVSGAQQPCPTCENVDLIGKPIRRALKHCQEPDGRSVALAGLFSHALSSVALINLWHIAGSSREIRSLVVRRGNERQSPRSTDDNGLCLICYRHYCPTHGAFVEKEADRETKADVFINDPEVAHNQRLTVTLSSPSVKSNLHNCGIFCGDPTIKVTELLGRHSDGNVAGTVRCTDIVDSSDQFQDSEACSKNCFWLVSNRLPDIQTIGDINPTLLKDLTDEQSTKLMAVMPLFLTDRRGPCLAAMALEDVSCLDIFYHMVLATNATPHDEEKMQQIQIARTKAKNRPDLTRDEFSLTYELDQRPPFVPCSHVGSCQNNPDCSCFANKVVCEWFCGCDFSCRRRYQGCNCAGTNRVCFSDSKCDCWSLNRECDPHLCGSCGVTEVLDPAHKYDEAIRHNRCRNNRLQIDVPKRTTKGPSEVQGWGLYAGEDIEQYDYIGEYKGEIVSSQESDRRGATYHNIGQEYLFRLNRDQEIDASNIGNKMRFMNNSTLKQNINVVAKKMLCNGVQRVMLYAGRKIRAGDELLYNYNYPSAVIKKFWERGEGPTTKVGGTAIRKTAFTKQARSNGRYVKTSNVQSRGPETSKTDGSINEHDLSQSPHLGRRKKRKRTLGEDERTQLSFAEDMDLDFAEESDFDADGALEDSSVSEDHFEGDDSGEESDESQPEPVPVPIKVRQRRISHNDRRRGGKAQRKAWKSRKANAQRSGASKSTART